MRDVSQRLAPKAKIAGGTLSRGHCPRRQWRSAGARLDWSGRMSNKNVFTLLGACLLILAPACGL
ncbi:MAG: hypothetical protein J5556_07180, partial [Deltaproteobacteria bacterium]|nr:hypothetical protein [Deltaproteobacteria bacterium]